MREDVYGRILYVIQNTKGSKTYPERECFKVLKELFPDVSDYTMGSIYSLEYMRKMKQNHFKISKFAEDLHVRFNAAVKEGQPDGILLRMSDEIDLSPALLARLIVQQWYLNELEENGETSPTKSPETNSADSSKIRDKFSKSLLCESRQGLETIKEEAKNYSKLVEEKFSSPTLPASDILKKKPSSITNKDPPTIDLVTETLEATTLTEAKLKIENTSESNSAEKSTTIFSQPSEVREKESTDRDHLPKLTVTRLMRNPSLIYDPHLAMETFLCNLHDDQYGPLADCIKHSLGQEYEMRLVRLAKAAGLVFRSEDSLRTTGFDKTPDIKLDVPAVVDGFIINWIESKALFGDDETHKDYVKAQYLSYWNRFGSGLVIYWFGYLDKIAIRYQEQFMVTDDFPKCISPMDPKPTITKCPRFR